jgi:twitching motility protein PilT
MGTPANPAAAPAAAPAAPFPTTAILSAMLRVSKQVSDLIFSPGRPPQVELNGKLVGVQIEQVPMLKSEDTARIAADLIGNNKVAIEKLRSA